METEILSLQFSMTFEMSLFIALRIKNPAFRRKTGFFHTPPFTALHRRPIVKRIQAGFLTYGSSYCGLASFLPSRPPCPFPSFDLPTHSRLRTVAPASFVPDYSGVAVPDFHGVPL